MAGGKFRPQRREGRVKERTARVEEARANEGMRKDDMCEEGMR